jgi:hypothetical protein
LQCISSEDVAFCQVYPISCELAPNRETENRKNYAASPDSKKGQWKSHQSIGESQFVKISTTGQGLMKLLHEIFTISIEYFQEAN